MQPSRQKIQTQQSQQKDKTNSSMIHEIHVKLIILHQLKNK